MRRSPRVARVGEPDAGTARIDREVRPSGPATVDAFGLIDQATFAGASERPSSGVEYQEVTT
jgi:hypothetical protein